MCLSPLHSASLASSHAPSPLFRPPSRNLIRVIRRRSRVKPGMSPFDLCLRRLSSRKATGRRTQFGNLGKVQASLTLLSLLLSFRPPSRNLIRVIRRRSRVKPGMNPFDLRLLTVTDSLSSQTRRVPTADGNTPQDSYSSNPDDSPRPNRSS